MRLHIETLSGYTHTIDCEPSFTIVRVLELITQEFGRKDEELKLIFKENELADWDLLSDYSIQNEDTLQALPAIDIRGGSVLTKFSSFSSVISGNGQSLKPSESLKQTFVIGVNLVGKCENQTCRINGVKQYFKMGLGEINVNK